MSHINRSCYKSEVKSKIGDYIRGKISAQSLMHPSRVNTKPIDKRKYNLHSGYQYETTRTDYQKKIRRPPLKDYIEGKVKLCDMISPSKITYIPKERKYQNLLPQCDVSRDEQRHRTTSFADSVETTNSQPGGVSGGGYGGTGAKYKDEWDKGQPPIPKATTSGGEFSLVPLRSTTFGPTGKRKLMCKIKVQRNDNAQNAEPKTEEHIIEIPEKILRRGHHSLPKFLMDRYNIPCYVNGAAGAKHPPKRKQPLSILAGSVEPAAVESEEPSSSPPPAARPKAQAIEYPVADGESSHVEVPADASKNADVDNIPSEQGDYNNATTYVFEFYEEEVPQEAKSAIIEEIEDDHSHREYAKSYTEDTRFNRHVFNDSLRSDEFQNYEEFKSNIYVQRELMDLHRGMLKCDKNFMVVEHNVNQVMASLNMLESVQNQEIKPSVMNIKMDHEKMRHQLQSLSSENEELKKSVQYLRKKTTDYDKVIYYIRHDSNMKIQELESKLETLTQTQVKSIEMQNTVNKNIIQITHGMKRVYSEQDSKHCCNSIKSPKNSNLTIS